MHAVRVRRARLADCWAIAHVQVHAYFETYEGIVPRGYLGQFTVAGQAAAWREWIQANRRSVLVVADAAGAGIVGYASGRLLPGCVYDAELSALYVASGNQRQGVGRALMYGVVRRLQLMGGRALTLWVMAENREALAVYQHWGGRIIAEQIWEDGVEYGAEVIELAVGWPQIAALRAALATPARIR